MNNCSGDGEHPALVMRKRDPPGQVEEAATAKSTPEREFSEAAGGPQEVTRRGKLFEMWYN